ncbi:hypothetical protein NDI39_04360 [Microcoleus sp. ZQ-A2]
MSLTEKLQSVFVIIAILLGLILGQIKWVEENAVSLIVPSLMVMLYGVFLNIPLNRLGQAFQNYKMTGLILGMNFLWTPVFVWGLGAIFLRDSPDLWVGLIMLMVTPFGRVKRSYPVGNRTLTALSLFNFLAELDRLLVDGVLQLYQQHEY